jgi:centrosomal protein CEP85
VKFLSSEESRDVLQKKYDGLERYLGDLPTSAENGKRSAELKTLKEERSRYKQRVAELDRRLSELNKGVMSRDNLIQSLEDSHHKLNSRLEEKERDVARMRKEMEVYRRDSRLPSFLFDDETQDLQQELAVLRGDFDKAKKVAEGLQRRLVQGEGKHRSVTRNLEEKLEHEQEAVMALKGELTTKDVHLKKLRHSIKQLGAENEDLLEKQIAMIGRVKDLEQQLSGDLRQLEQRLLADLGATFSELQALVQICTERAEGHDPNISILLGVKTVSTSSLDTQSQSTDSADQAQSLRFKLSRVFQLRKDIDHLRELVCNKYAEDMSENLNCTTQ